MTYITNDGTIVVEDLFFKTTVEERAAMCLLIRSHLQRITDTEILITVSKGEHSPEKSPNIGISIRIIRRCMELNQLVKCAEVAETVIKKFYDLICAIDDLKPLFNE